MFINKKVVPKSIRKKVYKLIRILNRKSRKIHEYLSEKYSEKLVFADESKIQNEGNFKIEVFSSDNLSLNYHGKKPFWLSFKNIELRKLGYYFSETEVIGRGILLNKLGEVIIESTIAQKLYLKKLTSNHLILFRKLIPLKKINKAIVLSNQLDDNYFHWFMECMGRLAFVPNDLVKNSKIILQYNSPSFQSEALSVFFGIKQADILYKKKFKRIKIEKTLIPTNPITITKDTYIYNPSVIRKLNSIALDLARLNKNKKNIIISRRGATQRRILNDKVLLKKFKSFNFQIVFLEDLNILNQINLFANSNIIIAVHGAGLTNLLFAKNPTIIEFFPCSRLERDSFYFYQISQALKFEHHIIEYKPNDFTQDLMLDSEKLLVLEKILDKFTG